MSQKFITGDTHGTIDIAKLDNNRFPYQNLTKNDYLFIAGDVWIDKANTLLQEYYNRKPYTTLYCDGNHENFTDLKSYPIEIWNGGKVQKITNSLIHLMRGQIYTIDNETYFVMGGAYSIDRAYRKLNISYWEEEMPSMEEYKEAENNLKRYNYKVDYVISHCCSSRTQYRINPTFKRDAETDWFNDIEAQLDFKHWYFGHYHIDENITDRHTALYNQIIPIGKSL